ncbi:MAG: glycyl-radical enzyme activating protein [Cetobacterium sp.]|uniref:trans-4-hydroxy-L-proline dehydratase activase n=1 Tax=Cetobacterium sp. TaxID=2071632 RepID=UPI002FC83EAC
MGIPYVINIQKYSLHDGDGIRTTIFFKGCLLNCLWCHNPESQSYTPELLFNYESCEGCKSCEKICPEHIISVQNGIAKTKREECKICETCLDYCLNNAREIVGKQYSIAELMNEIEKDKMFYEESGGGITLSGGEIMTQDINYILELLKKLKMKGYNVMIDTCGHAPQKNYETILPYVDTFLYDIKMMDNELHKKYMGKENELILSNLKYLSNQGANIYIRIPLIGNVNSSVENIEEIVSFLKNNINLKKINLLPYHNTGSGKYKKLDLEYLGENFTTPTIEEMEQFINIFKKNGFSDIKIGG